MIPVITFEEIRKLPVYQRKGLFAKMCNDKKIFTSLVAAERSAKWISEKHDDPNISVYKCPFCGWWHYGHVTGWERKTEPHNGKMKPDREDHNGGRTHGV